MHTILLSGLLIIVLFILFYTVLAVNRNELDEAVLMSLIAFILSEVVTVFDLLSSGFSKESIKLGWMWVLLYLLINGAFAIGVFWGLVYLDITVSGFAIPLWVKAVLAGLMFPEILKTRLFAIKVKETGDSVGPEITYQHITRVIKKYIAREGLPGNIAVLNQLLSLSTKELSSAVDLLLAINDLWINDPSERERKMAEIDKWRKEITDEDQLRKKYAGFIFENAPAEDISRILSDRHRLSIMNEMSKELLELSEFELSSAVDLLLFTDQLRISSPEEKKAKQIEVNKWRKDIKDTNRLKQLYVGFILENAPFQSITMILSDKYRLSLLDITTIRDIIKKHILQNIREPNKKQFIEGELADTTPDKDTHISIILEHLTKKEIAGILKSITEPDNIGGIVVPPGE